LKEHGLDFLLSRCVFLGASLVKVRLLILCSDSLSSEKS
jgi:hypothetical protein